MPAIIVSRINFESNRYRIDLGQLADVFPHIKEGKEVKLYLIEVRNERDKLVKRFKPFKEVTLNIGKYWSTNKYKPCLELSEDIVSRLNIGENYRVTIVLITYDGKPFLPLEIKCIGYDSERVFEYFSKIEAELLSLIFEQSELNEAASSLWDAYFRLEENDVEGARTALRNSLEVLKKELLPKLTVPEKSEESKTFLNKLEKLVASLQDFLHYGGPHPGPAPRTTTEMILSLSIELIKYLAKSIETKVISFQEMKPNVS